MDIITVVKTSFLVASLVLLTACSDPSEVFEQGSTDNTSVGADGINETEPTSIDSISDDVQSVVTPTETADPALSDESARYWTMDCGSLPVSTALSGSAESAPGTMTVGQLVSGRIDPESSTSAEHYWSVELEPGEYHLVLDTESADGSWSNLNIGVTNLQDSGEVELLEGKITDYRARFHTYFSVEAARTMVLGIRGYNSAENYVFGIFKNRTQVPAPFFHKCPTVKSLSLDTTETFVLPREENSTDGHWFKANLLARDFSINTSASHIDGATCQLQYEFSLVDQFGQSERFTPIGSIDEPGPVATNSVVKFERAGFGNIWIRVQNNNCELSMEFTLSQDN